MIACVKVCRTKRVVVCDQLTERTQFSQESNMDEARQKGRRTTFSFLLCSKHFSPDETFISIGKGKGKNQTLKKLYR